MIGTQSHATPNQSNANEHDAIISVINAETQAFADADFEAWAACWAQDDRVKNICVSPIGQSVTNGWTENAAQMRHALIQSGGCGMVRFRQTNFQVNTDARTAWVTFDQQAEDDNGKTWESFETRILERIEDEWKIVYVLFLEKQSDHDAKSALCVDQKGHIVWAKSETFDRLKHHPHLTISAGRIRARHGEWDRILQTAIANAGRYHSFFEQWQFSRANGRPFQYPVVLGESDEGSVIVVQVSIQSNATYILFDPDHALDHRLNVAQAVFGLSEGQLRVARNIADGHGLKETARILEISVNTARTHLARLYEKTGVNSQTALVRLLLSVG